MTKFLIYMEKEKTDREKDALHRRLLEKTLTASIGIRLLVW